MVSRNDGQRHFVGVASLTHLYGIRPGDDIRIYDDHGYVSHHLRPRYEGDYPNVHADG
jgi:hypothetical protein